MNVFQLIVAGGPLMIPIVLCSLAVTAVIIERWNYYQSADRNSSALKTKIRDCLSRDDIRAAVEACEADDSISARIMKAGLFHYSDPGEGVAAAMDSAARFEIPALEQRLTFLSAAGNLAPLIGLLGTVTGFCRVFQTVQDRTAAMFPVSPADIAGGVWQALLTTVAGLLVSIPAYAAYNYFCSRSRIIVLHLEKDAAELADLVRQIRAGVARDMDR